MPAASPFSRMHASHPPSRASGAASMAATTEQATAQRIPVAVGEPMAFTIQAAIRSSGG